MSQGLIDQALQPSRLTVCEYVRDKPLTLNVLWDIAYNIHKESLRLDSLEDFNATEADIMHMKEDILATWKSRDTRKTLSLRPTFISSADSRSRGSTLGKTFIPGEPAPSSSVPHVALVVVVMHDCHIIIGLQASGPTTWDSHSSWAVPLPSRSTACQLSCDGSACRVQL